MYIEVDLNVLPPALALREEDDFKMFKIVVTNADHVWVDVDQITALAGAKGQDAAWREGLQGMLAYAQQHDYIDDQGRVRGHVEAAG